MLWTNEARKYCPNGLVGNKPFAAWMSAHLEGGLLVDVGANVGAVCVATLLGSKGSRAVAFEPQTRAADALVELAAKNGVDVELRRAAVSSYVGEAVLKFPLNKTVSGWATIADEPDFYQAANRKQEVETETVRVTTLDTWWAEAGKPKVRVIKVDVQGAECDVLEGGWKLFETVPYLFIEKHKPTLGEHGRTVADLKGMLADLGFTFKDANRNNLYCWKEGK